MRKIECDRCLKVLSVHNLYSIEIIPPDYTRGSEELAQTFDCCRECLLILRIAILTGIASPPGFNAKIAS